MVYFRTIARYAQAVYTRHARFSATVTYYH